MENFTDHHFNATVVGDATWTVALLLSHTLLGLLSFIWAFVAKPDRLGFLAESLVVFFSCKRRGVQAVHECLWALLLADLLNAITTVFFRSSAQLFFLPLRLCSSLWVVGPVQRVHGGFTTVLFMHNSHLGTKLQLIAMFVAVFLVVFIPFYVL